jgi:hypothetical protein
MEGRRKSPGVVVLEEVDVDIEFLEEDFRNGFIPSTTEVSRSEVSSTLVVSAGQQR